MIPAADDRSPRWVIAVLLLMGEEAIEIEMNFEGVNVGNWEWKGIFDGV